ncbi:hypothetical protein [Thalassovita mediterranea]|jgi:hypothetical protein|uniref:Uncharacterized protein n=1 Tax=Thalassovita mediterranea TaxID=340021 RepID=A0A0P1GQH1_9RHOB|nr:hypothetical protein [Thalassovita mediterranea]CUH84704.1 hypothetical protein TM5383_01916 [Thalassovita mediterranea]SIS32410.1 hypothetical protein SAMN05421685_106161 [Thalassovita mediterranea]
MTKTTTLPKPDSPTILTLRIDNSEPIELNDFVGAFTSLARAYRNQAAENPDIEDNAEIYVKEVRKGSIEADLLPYVMSTAPIIAQHADQALQAIEFVAQWRQRITDLIEGNVPKDPQKSDLDTFSSAVAAIARDPNATSTLEAATFEDGKREVRAAFKFNTKQAIQAEQTLQTAYKQIKEERTKRAERVLMTFTRSDIKDTPNGKRSGERVVIDEISKRDLAIMYASDLAKERVKHEVREADENVYKKGFVVDVMIVSKNEKAVAYKILEVHEVIDLPDDIE